jgi:hypothetical protein
VVSQVTITASRPALCNRDLLIGSITSVNSTDETSHQGLGDSPDATLLHKTLPLARSGDRLELNSKAELNLPGSSSADEVTNYSEVAAPEGCPW